MGINKEVVSASKWISITNIANRLIQFLYFTFVIRSLTIEEIGIYGLITTIIQISYGATSSGFKVALIQKRANDASVDFTVWVVEIIKGCLLYIAIISFSGILSNIFEIKLDNYLYLAALIIIFNSAANIRVLEFNKSLNYKGLFILKTIPTFVRTALGFLLVYLYPNLWTVLAIYVFQSILYLIASYIIVKPHPLQKLNLKETFHLTRFGKWIMAANIVFIFSLYVDDLIIAKYLNTALLGTYTIAFTYANIGVMEFGNILKEVSFPTFSILQNDKKESKKMLLQLTDVITVIVVVICGILILNAKEIIFILIKNTNNNIVPVFQILCIGAALRSLSGIYGSYFKGIGKPKFSFQLNSIRLVVLLLSIFPLMDFFKLIGVAFASALSMVATFSLVIYFLKISFPSEWKIFVKEISKNLITGIIAGLATYLIIIKFENFNPFIKVLTSTVIFLSLIILTDGLIINRNKKNGFTFWIIKSLLKFNKLRSPF